MPGVTGLLILFLGVLSFPSLPLLLWQQKATPSPEPLRSSSAMRKIPSGQAMLFLLGYASRTVKTLPSRDPRRFLRRRARSRVVR